MTRATMPVLSQAGLAAPLAMSVTACNGERVSVVPESGTQVAASTSGTAGGSNFGRAEGSNGGTGGVGADNTEVGSITASTSIGGGRNSSR